MDEIGHMQMEIDDMNDKFDKEIAEINEGIKAAAVKNKLIREKKPYQFREFNITDTYYDKSKQVVCFKCSKGLKCPTHKFLKKDVIEGDENVKPKNLGKKKERKVKTSSRIKVKSGDESSLPTSNFNSGK